jgi:hypothetical protein
MGNTWTLESLIEEADEKYGSCSITFGNEKTELRNPIRINEKERQRVIEVLKSIQVEKEAAEVAEKAGEDYESTLDTFAALTEILTLVGDTKTPKLLTKVGSDLAVLMALFNKYQVDVGLGEAPTSSE